MATPANNAAVLSNSFFLMERSSSSRLIPARPIDVDTGKRFGFMRRSARGTDLLRGVAALAVGESMELNLQNFLGIGWRAATQNSFKRCDLVEMSAALALRVIRICKIRRAPRGAVSRQDSVSYRRLRRRSVTRLPARGFQQSISLAIDFFGLGPVAPGDDFFVFVWIPTLGPHKG